MVSPAAEFSDPGRGHFFKRHVQRVSKTRSAARPTLLCSFPKRSPRGPRRHTLPPLKKMNTATSQPAFLASRTHT